MTVISQHQHGDESRFRARAQNPLRDAKKFWTQRNQTNQEAAEQRKDPPYPDLALEAEANCVWRLHHDDRRMRSLLEHFPTEMFCWTVVREYDEEAHRETQVIYCDAVR